MAIGDSIKREGAVRPSSIEKDVFEQAVWANRTVVIPLNMTRRWWCNLKLTAAPLLDTPEAGVMEWGWR